MSSVIRKIDLSKSGGRPANDKIAGLKNSDEKTLFLTFDDGPDSHSTESVLEVLNKKSMKATFFVVANQAKKNASLLKRVVSEGHAIGNHSLDHTYHRLFMGKKALKQWVEDGEKALQDLLGEPTIGFRPPNGILTPELKRALHELQVPIILWNIRFYDALFAWTEKRALQSLSQTTSGSIVLLHDRQSPEKLPLFLHTFSTYSDHIQQQGYRCKALSREVIERAYLT